MSYVVIARKWRPKAFDEVVGQEHITTTLKNAIAQNRVAHAYLFSGPRGIGKTSTARIFAKALNCEKGPTPTPCNRCASCEEIAEGRSLDVLEIDGASNRGIDEVRELRENVKFSPTKGKYKIYIIDEVHMLTTEAFNALLKTLEEPPAHVKFIFATTNPQKVLPTILSRCQRFDFRRIATAQLVEKLKEISKKEGIKADEDALFLIAKSAQGSLRDAETVLDELASFCEGKIEAKDVASVLGVVGTDEIFAIFDSVIKKDIAGCFRMVGALIDKGKDLSQLAIGLMEHARNLLISKVGKELGYLIELPKEETARLKSQSDAFSTEDLIYIFHILSQAQDSLRRALNQRVIVEMTLTKLAQKESLFSLNEIVDKVEALQAKLGQLEEQQPQTKHEVRETKSEIVDRSGENASFEAVKASWDSIVENVKAQKMSCGLFLAEGRPVFIRDGILTIMFPKASLFHMESLKSKDKIALLEKAIKEMTDMSMHLNFEIDESAVQPANAAEGGTPPSGGGRKSIMDEPIINAVREIFGADIKGTE